MNFNSTETEKHVLELMEDDDVTHKSGIFEYLLSEKNKACEKYLHIRAFTKSQQRSRYTQQEGKCKKCGKECKFEDMEADHIKPWSKGGHTEPSNLQMLCKDCNRRKADR